MSNTLARAMLARQAQFLSAMSQHNLPALILLTDDERLPDPLAATSALPRGSAVILRSRSKAKRCALAAPLREIAWKNDLFFLVADDPQLAMEVHANGIHLPESRAHEAAHWRALRPDWFITCAAHSEHGVVRARTFGADAALLSPVFATKSHPNRAPLTQIRLRFIVTKMSVPIYALGGIDARNAARLQGAPLAGIAAIGALEVRREI
jgi:thiamine-phosphate pyrophosphorylase